MDGNDRTGARRDRRLDLTDVHQEIVIPDINEYRAGAENLDRGDGRDRGVRYRDDLIAGADACGRERDVNRVGSAVDPDRTPDADIGRHLALEPDPLRSENELAGFEHAIDRGENFIP